MKCYRARIGTGNAAAVQLKHTAIADKLNEGVVDLTTGVHTGINVFLGSSLNGQRSLNVLNEILREREYSIAHRARSCAATEIVDLEPLPDSTAGFRVTEPLPTTKPMRTGTRRSSR